METDASLCFKGHPFPGYISSGKVVYGTDDKHPERIFSTFVAMFIEEGTLYFTEGDAAYTLKAGEWFIQTPGIRHYGHQAGGRQDDFPFRSFLAPRGMADRDACLASGASRASRMAARSWRGYPSSAVRD
ncbi:AraC family ligand binding domain-containing protein [Cohnella rhizosphaerae]|uniref:AraC family ligand binding domain-containing protein n=1 Tax=Cohnella rhizosphaerae TaxID=1457232 RepID=A0A9X4QSB9_9BACL|nr:AraC family ligand binding domain-containing protein [Cohnella rhizosphaerae]MDG0809144.1 AraC family ligand binding domain-containing protein [Cohnella rhizosphaerae]